MLIVKLIQVNLIMFLCFAQTTNINRQIYSRQRRYLKFPAKSNFVVSPSLSKPLQQLQPRGWNVLAEMDVPFALPEDTIFHKKFRRNHYIQRRQIFDEMEQALTKGGLNGAGCVKRMICEAREYTEASGKSLTRDLLAALFTYQDLQDDYEDVCGKDILSECEIPLLHYTLQSLQGS